MKISADEKKWVCCKKRVNGISRKVVWQSVEHSSAQLVKSTVHGESNEGNLSHFIFAGSFYAIYRAVQTCFANTHFSSASRARQGNVLFLSTCFNNRNRYEIVSKGKKGAPWNVLTITITTKEKKTRKDDNVILANVTGDLLRQWIIKLTLATTNINKSATQHFLFVLLLPRLLLTMLWWW